MKKMLEKVINGQDLSFEEAHQAMLHIMHGEVNSAQIAAYLIALKIKGEHEQEIGGSARAMRDVSVKLQMAPDFKSMDVCGTGGDNSHTINISTLTTFIVAASGVKVAKHGNRSISSKSGSADVLKQLGVNINLSAERSKKALEEIGVTFLFAPDYHPAMKHAAPVRRELGTKTIFNMLGPLTNPAGTRTQLIGTFDTVAAEKMARSLQFLDMDRVCFICTENKYDEVTLSGETHVIEYHQGEVNRYKINNRDFGYPKIDIATLAGDSPEYNARVLREILSGKVRDSRAYVACANAAMALYTNGFSGTLKDCVQYAEEALLSGKAQAKLDQLIEFGRDDA
jgi:anthranilate phosphoribosyltransferase